jgi:hypothetical protein
MSGLTTKPVNFFQDETEKTFYLPLTNLRSAQVAQPDRFRLTSAYAQHRSLNWQFLLPDPLMSLKRSLSIFNRKELKCFAKNAE